MTTLRIELIYANGGESRHLEPLWSKPFVDLSVNPGVAAIIIIDNDTSEILAAVATDGTCCRHHINLDQKEPER